MTEWNLQRAVAKYLNHAVPSDCVWTAIDAGQGQMDAIAGANRRERGIKAGWPDIVMIYRGQFHAIELKSPDGRLSGIQKVVSSALLEAGARYRVIRSVSALAEVLALWGIPCCLGPLAMKAEQYDVLLQQRAEKPKAPARKRRTPTSSAATIARMHAAGLWRP